MEVLKLCFNTEYFDDRASLTRNFYFTYFIEWNGLPYVDDIKIKELIEVIKTKGKVSVSLFDIKTKKLYLKKTKIDQNIIPLSELYLGNTISLFARKIKLLDFADLTTKTIFKQQTKTNNSKLFITAKMSSLELPKVVIDLESMNYRVMKVFTNLDENNDKMMTIVLKGTSELTETETLKLKTKYKEVNMRHDEENIERTSVQSDNSGCLVLILPHILRERQFGHLFLDLQQALHIEELEIINTKAQFLETETAKSFLEVYNDVISSGELHSWKCELSSGVSIALEINEISGSKKGDLTERVRAILGPRKLDLAKQLRENSLRAVYAKNNTQVGLHCTDLESEQEDDLTFMFQLVPSLN